MIIQAVFVISVVTIQFEADMVTKSDPQLRIHELLPSLPTRAIYLHWPAGRTQSPLVARAIEVAIEVAAEIAEQYPEASALRPVARRAE